MDVDSIISSLKQQAAFCSAEQLQEMQQLMASMQLAAHRQQAQAQVPGAVDRDLDNGAASATTGAAAAAATPTSNKTPSSNIPGRSIPTGNWNSGGMSACREKMTRSPSTKRANEIGAEQSRKSSKANHTLWPNDFEEEIEKSRDLKDKLSDFGGQLSDYGDNLKQMKLEKYRYATSRLAGALVKESDAAAGTLIVLVKKKSLSMRELLGKWQDFQDTYGSNQEVGAVHSAGPVWTVKCKCVKTVLQRSTESRHGQAGR